MKEKQINLSASQIDALIHFARFGIEALESHPLASDKFNDMVTAANQGIRKLLTAQNHE